MKTENITVLEITTQANSGCGVMSGLREAIVLAFTEGHVVDFTHDTRTYTIDPIDILAGIPSKTKV